ncbi:hypothetical protein JEZ13_09770 [bacterium]|nr:hypothetical protein [bacterium]
MKTITFRYQPPIATKLDVYLVGDFNNWSKSSHRLNDKGGIYEISLELDPGEYKYFLLINGIKSLDPNADSIVIGDETYSFLKVTSDQEYIYLIPFKIKDKLKLEEVSIVGDFNHWKPNHNPLYKEGRAFTTSLFLKKGAYHYKYLAKGDRWFNEHEIEENIAKIAFDNRSKNSIIDVSKQLNIFIKQELIAYHDSNEVKLKSDIIKFYRYSQDQFEIKVVLPKFPQVQVKLFLDDAIYELDYIASDGNLSAYNKILEIDKLNHLYSYRIAVNFKEFSLYAHKTSLTNNPATYSVFVPLDYPIFSIAKDLHNRIMYQIMPDRFYNCDSSLNPDFKEAYYRNSKNKPKKLSLTKHQEYHHLAKWDNLDILKENPYSANKEPDWFAFYGGDLKGVREKIPYLKELGISLIYLNPIFVAKSPHRYDSIDFKQVDPHLGDNESFKVLVSDLHKHEIKVIIDIALNHCGTEFFAFQDTVKYGNKSKYWSWFDWYKWPLPEIIDQDFKAEDYYQCWWGIKDLPEFNFDLLRESPAENRERDILKTKPNVELVNYLLDAMSFWVEEMKIDGFRLDVPEEVPFWFWQLFRRRMKQINPDIYLVGEIWNDSQVWLQGQYFDAIMNYHAFKDPCVSYFLNDGISLKSFINAISLGLVTLPDQVIRSQMNLLASHDTIRVRRLADNNIKRIKLALIFQFTFIGIPHIYYGDEVFLDGYKDPDNRRPFPWDYQNDTNRNELLEFYKLLIKVRGSHIEFTEGNIRFIEDQHLLIYERWIKSSNQKAIVLINNSDFELDIKEYMRQFPNILLAEMDSPNIFKHGFYIGTNHS